MNEPPVGIPVFVTAVLLALAPACASAQETKRSPLKNAKVAFLGVETRAPSGAEAKKHALPMAVRWQGQVVTEAKAKGPAAAAGLSPGGVIMKLGANTIFSRDDIADFLRTNRPGEKVVAEIVRGRSSKCEKVTLILGGRKADRSSGASFWQYAGLPQLKTVLVKSKKDKQRILVGLSGAET